MKGKKIQKLKSKSRTRQSGINNEITGIILIAFGILVLLSFYFVDSIGPFGHFIRNLLLGFMGLPSFVVPPAIIVVSVFILLRKDDGIFRIRLIYTFILLLIFSSMLHAGGYSPGKYVNLNPVESLRLFYRDGLTLEGGGVLGGIVATPFLITFNILGTIIILTTLAVIDIIMLTNISIANFARNIRAFFTAGKGVRPVKKAVPPQSTSLEDDAEGPGIVGEGENLSIDFKPGPKVIDFKIEKTSRDLKEKTSGNSAADALAPDTEAEVEPINFIMKDLKKARPSGKVKAEEPVVPVIAVHEAGGIGYVYPVPELLKEPGANGKDIKSFKNIALEGAMKLEETLNSFGVDARVVNVSRGPSVTRYELKPGVGVKVNKIANLSDDIALHLASAGVRIEAPIPGKDAIGIEVPNKEVMPVLLREVIESEEFANSPSKLAFALGRDISGDIVVADIAKMPHVLIAGATGAGKSVCINNLILSLLFKASPDEVKLILVDPKVVELGIYNGIPHLLLPVVTDPKKAAGALNWAVQEMLNRYNLFSDKGVKDIKGFNQLMEQTGEEPLMPQIVIIIDELADLMMAAPNDVEDAICRLAQMARAAGMHLVIATQRPSVDVITGVIKANIPSRISFAVTSQVDSRTILDMAGAEKLLGRGDMLFYPSGKPKPIRVQGAYHVEKEIELVVDFVKKQGEVEYDIDLIEKINSENDPVENDPGDNDELLPQAIELVVDSGMASVSFIQRKFKVGYARAARIVDQMEARGVVGGHEGSKPRQVLISRQQWQEMQMAEEN